MLSHYGLNNILRVEAYTEGTIRFVEICYQRYPFGRPGDRCYDTFCKHVIEHVLYLLPVLDWDFALSMLNGVPDMLPMVPNELGKAHFNAIMSQTTDVEQGAVTLVNCA